MAGNKHPSDVAAVEQQMQWRGLSDQVDELSSQLEHEETVECMAPARALRPGLFAVTDRRVLFVRQRRFVNEKYSFPFDQTSSAHVMSNKSITVAAASGQAIKITVTGVDPATAFGVDDRQLVRLALCRTPCRDGRFVADTITIATHIGTDPDRLTLLWAPTCPPPAR